MYGEGISRTSELVDLGVKLRSGQQVGRLVLVWAIPRLGQGRDAAKQYFKEHPDIADEVQREIMLKVEEERSKNSAGAAVKLSESVATAPAEKPAAPKPSSAKAVSIDADDFDDLDDEE